MTKQDAKSIEFLRTALVAFGLFCVVNVASYFLRSSGYGVIEVNDGIFRVGFPFVIFERGGIDGHEFFSVSAALGNLLVASVTTALALGIGHAMKRVTRDAES